jgi:hypothetical protein
VDRIEKLNPDKSDPDRVGSEASQTQALEKARAANEAEYQKALADDLERLVCSGDESASYVVHRLVDTGRISHAGPFAPGLIDSILAPSCPVSAVLTEAILSFLGAGISPETPTWGNIMAEGRAYFQIKPSLIFWPGLLLSIAILSVNLIGDAARDALDPRMKQRESSK